MSEANNTTKQEKKQYHHLTIKERAQIEVLLNQKDQNGKRICNNSAIARAIGVDKSTISRELRKRIKSKIIVRSGKIINKPYNATDAQNDYLTKRGASKATYKLDRYPVMAKFIEDKILHEKWSADTVVGYMKRNHYFEREGFTSITTPTVYYAIRYNIINVQIKDTRRMKENSKRERHEKKTLPLSKLSYSIDNRPEEIDKRLVFGHFELDTVLGRKGGKKECLMTLTERKTRFEMVFKLQAKTSQEVVDKFHAIKDFMKLSFDKVFKSITTDNGSEFADFLEIIKNTKANIYFCHPYCSGEKGTNEKHNSLIRYFIPKGTLIEQYSFEQINEMVDWLNNYPRKVLDYRTPLEALLEEFDDKKVINKIYKLQEKINC